MYFYQVTGVNVYSWTCTNVNNYLCNHLLLYNYADGSTACRPYVNYVYIAFPMAHSKNIHFVIKLSMRLLSSKSVCVCIKVSPCLLWVYILTLSGVSSCLHWNYGHYILSMYSLPSSPGPAMTAGHKSASPSCCPACVLVNLLPAPCYSKLLMSHISFFTFLQVWNWFMFLHQVCLGDLHTILYHNCSMYCNSGSFRVKKYSCVKCLC